MTDYVTYKNQLETQYNRKLYDILYDIYIARDMGPSVGAKHLGIPRHVFVYYRNAYDLQKIKRKHIAQNEVGCEQ